MAVIGIKGEMGSYGSAIAAGVAKALACPLVHREIVDRVASHWAMPKAAVLDMKSFTPAKYPRYRSIATRYVACVTAEILSVAAAGRAVFHGWGAAQLFYKVPQAMSVHIGAPQKIRIERMQERLGLDERTAKRIVQDDDAMRSLLGREYYGSDLADSNGYDVSINTGRTSVEDAIEEIVALARRPSFEETPQMQRSLQNLRLEAIARASLYCNPETRDLRLHLKADGEELIVGGIVNDGKQREEVIRTLTDLPGGSAVTSRLRAPTDFRTRSSSM